MISSTSNLTAHAAQAIQFHPHLKQSSVNVHNENGTFVLSGTVDSFFEKQMAQESLRALPGVQTIDNSIRVAWN
jgi:osmotically-inducible protein OsmY